MSKTGGAPHRSPFRPQLLTSLLFRRFSATQQNSQGMSGDICGKIKFALLLRGHVPLPPKNSQRMRPTTSGPSLRARTGSCLSPGAGSSHAFAGPPRSSDRLRPTSDGQAVEVLALQYDEDMDRRDHERKDVFDSAPKGHLVGIANGPRKAVGASWASMLSSWLPEPRLKLKSLLA